MQMKIDVNQMFSFKAPFLLEELYKKKYTLIHRATLTQKLVPDLKVFIALTKPASLGTPNPGAEIKVRVEKRLSTTSKGNFVPGFPFEMKL